MTKGQIALEKKFTTLMGEISEPLLPYEKNHLVEILTGVSCDSLWGLAINKAFKDGADIDNLINDLSSQAADDPFTMACVVGMPALKMLLRHHQ